MEVKGIFVIKNGKDSTIVKIEDLGKKYSSKTLIHSGSNSQQIATFKAYCHDVVEMFKECFEMEMWGISRCKRFVEGLSATMSDVNKIPQSLLVIFNMLIDLLSIAKEAIPIKDMPSCKALTELSVEDAIAASKDLIKSDIIKGISGALLVGVKTSDFVNVVRVKSYYSNLIKELNTEIADSKRSMSSIEQFLMDKYEAEMGYCDLALIKIGTTGLHEVAKLTELAEKNIAKYEKHNLENKVLAMPAI